MALANPTRRLVLPGSGKDRATDHDLEPAEARLSEPPRIRVVRVHNDEPMVLTGPVISCAPHVTVVRRRGVDDAFADKPLDARVAQSQGFVERGIHVHRHLERVTHVADYAEARAGLVRRGDPLSPTLGVPSEARPAL